MADYDVIVIGGGPAGYAAALAAAANGATVALVEPERLGGACVNHSCIPTNTFTNALATHIDARELDVHGVIEAGERFHWARAVARKDVLVRLLAEGIGTALRQRKVRHLPGRASFRDPATIDIRGADGPSSLSAEAFVIATGARWEPPMIPGMAPEQVLTADSVLALPAAPSPALVLGGGPAETAFALEYAALLAGAGAAVTLAVPSERLVPALDAEIAQAAATFLSDLGVQVCCGWTPVRGDGVSVTLTNGEAEIEARAGAVVAVDARRPHVAGLNLVAAGVTAADRIAVGPDCRTNVPHIFAAGDVTGGAMLSGAAAHMGEVAGVNAAGGMAHTQLRTLPHLLHTVPELAWVGQSEAVARATGVQVRVGQADLSFNPRAVALGSRQGLVKVVADAGLGELLGVQVAGPGAGEIIAVAAALMQAEVTVDDLAAMVAWHPSMTEGLIEAARRSLG